MKIKPIIDSTRSCVAKNINKSILIAPMLLAVSIPETLAKDTFSKMDSSKMIQTTIQGVNDSGKKAFDCSFELNAKNETTKRSSSERTQKKIFKLEAKRNKYREEFQKKEAEYKYYNTILRAINGDKKAKQEIFKQIQQQSHNRDVAVFAASGLVGVAASLITGPAGLLICMSSFFTSNQLDKYIVNKKTHPKQKQSVIDKIQNLEEDMEKIKKKISSVQHKISELV